MRIRKTMFEDGGGFKICVTLGHRGKLSKTLEFNCVYGLLIPKYCFEVHHSFNKHSLNID